MKLYPIIFLALILLPMAMAAEDYEYDVLGTFKQYTCIQLIQTCPNCTFVNISSVTYPDSTQALGLVAMQKAGTFYNYTFCNTSYTGTYRVSGYGDINNVDNYYETFTYVLYITPGGGFENNTTIFIFLLIISFVILVLGFMFHNHIFSLISGFGFLVVGVYSMIYGFGNITNVYTRIVSIIIIALGAFITIVSSLEIIRESEEPGYDSSEDDYDYYRTNEED